MAYTKLTRTTAIIPTIQSSDVCYAGLAPVSSLTTKEPSHMPLLESATNGSITQNERKTLAFFYLCLEQSIANIMKNPIKTLTKVKSGTSTVNSEIASKNPSKIFIQPQKPRVTTRGDLHIVNPSQTLVSASTGKEVAPSNPAITNTSAITTTKRPVKKLLTPCKTAMNTNQVVANVMKTCSSPIMMNNIDKTKWMTNFLIAFEEKLKQYDSNLKNTAPYEISQISLNYAKNYEKSDLNLNDNKKMFNSIKYDYFHSLKSAININLNQCPDSSDFKLMQPSEKNVNEMLKNNWQQVKYPTFNKHFKTILSTVEPLWSKMSYLHKDTAISMIIGFIENQNTDQLAKYDKNRVIKTIPTPQIRNYIKDEINSGRLIRIQNIQEKFKQNEIIMSRCLSIKKPDKNEYRFVYDNVPCNEFILPIGFYQSGPISFTTPSIETVLLNKVYFDSLLVADWAMVFDATSYYRQIFTHGSAWNLSMFQLSSNETYLDITSRMGHVNSALSAQRVSDLKDWLFNVMNPLDGMCLTNQDDSLLINSNRSTGIKFRSLSEKLGITINEAKNQSGSKVVWCGFELDVERKMIRIREKRIGKLKECADKILGSKVVIRREIAVFLGSVHSCRPIILGQWKFTSPLLFFTRKSTFLFQDIYDGKVLDSAWYQEKMLVNDLMRFEIAEAYDLVTKEVSMVNAREGLKNYLSSGCYIGRGQEKNLVYSDASDHYWGVTLKIGEEKFSFSGDFDEFIRENWSIYVKEYYACIVAKLLFYYCSKKSHNLTRFTVHFIDNTGAKAVLQSKKVSLRSIEIGVLSKFNQLISDKLDEKYWRYEFIGSEDNRWADFCTREGVNEVCNLSAVFHLFCPFGSLLSGSFGVKNNTKLLTNNLIKNLNI